MNEKPLSKVRPGRAPADLRERVLHAAAAASVEGRLRRRWTGFDLGLAATILLLLASHAAMSLRGPRAAAPQQMAQERRQALLGEQRSALDLELLGVRLETTLNAPAERAMTLETVLRTTS